MTDTRTPAPRFHDLAAPGDLGGATVDGPARWVALPGDGATGGRGAGGDTAGTRGGYALQATSAHTRITLPGHTLNGNAGTLACWMLCLEDLRTAPPIKHIADAQPDYRTYPLFLAPRPEAPPEAPLKPAPQASPPPQSPASPDAPHAAPDADLPDRSTWPEWRRAPFAWVWSSMWYPQCYAKFYRGNVYPDAYNPKFNAFVATGHLNLDRLRWYHLALTFDRDASRYRIYINGVPAAVENQFRRLAHETAGEALVCGNPAFAFADVMSFDAALTHEQVQALYADRPDRAEPELVEELERIFAGAPLNTDPPDLGEGWETALHLPLTDPADLEQLYHQGGVGAVSMTGEGLRIDTPDRPADWKPPAPGEDPHQMYLWTRRSFEGDLDVTFDFKPLDHMGLLLFMAQASGMQGEDFMADYPLRTTGAMLMVYGENVRNYHWEFFREMDDARNDVASHVLVKNPWMRPLAYRCARGPLALHEWHTLRFLQVGPRIRGFIDGRPVFDVTDDPYCHAGPVYRTGRVAIRAMIRTSALLRDLHVRTRLADLTTRALDA